MHLVNMVVIHFVLQIEKLSRCDIVTHFFMLEEFLSVEDKILMVVYILSEVLFVMSRRELDHSHDVVYRVNGFLLN